MTKMVQFGCGTHELPNWENTNIQQVDVTQPLPYPDNSVDFIFHEHLLEHLDMVDGFNFLQECYRILKYGGVMRISCPTMEGIIWVYQNWDNIGYEKWKAEHNNDKNRYINNALLLQIAGYEGKYFGSNNEVIAVKRSKGWHKYFDDRQSITKKLNQIGFSTIKFLSKHQSSYPELKQVEGRVGGKFDEYPPELEMTLEAKK